MPQPTDPSEPAPSPRFPDLRELEEFEQLLRRLRELHACALGIPKFTDGVEVQQAAKPEVQPHMGPRVTPVEVVMCLNPPDIEPTVSSLYKSSPSVKHVEPAETSPIQDAKPPKVSPRNPSPRTSPRTWFHTSASDKIPPCVKRQPFLTDFKALKNCMNQDELNNGRLNRHPTEIPGPLQKRLMPIVDSVAFAGFSSAVILLNCVLLGWVVNRNSELTAAGKQMKSEDVSLAFRITEWAMTIWFIIEVGMRAIAAGPGFFRQEHYHWNVFDIIVVALDIADHFIHLMNAEGIQFPDFTAVRIIRVLRIVRTLRMIKVMHGFRDFRMMVNSILHSGSALFWTTVLFSFIIFVFSIYFMQTTTFFLATHGVLGKNSAKLIEHWGSVAKSSYTLFLCMSGGISWVEISAPLLKIHWVHTAMLSFYMFFMTFVVTNIVMGIFVDSVIQSAQGDREEVVEVHMNEQSSALSQLREIFLDADEDGNRMITLEEFQERAKDPMVWANLLSLGLEVSEARGLFNLLDMDGSGSVGIEEFLMGCMRLKGYAKTIDLATLMYENKRLTHHATSFYKFAREEFASLVERVSEIEKTCSQLMWQSAWASQRPSKRVG